MAAQPINPLSRRASSTLGFDANPAAELQQELAMRRKKALQAANLGSALPSQMLGKPSLAP